jgi:hypothetical protein
MFHHGSNMNLADIFRSTPSDTVRHEDDRYQRSIRILCMLILFNICSLDASAVNSGLPVMIAYFLPFLGDVEEAGTFCTNTLPLPTQRPSVPPGIRTYTIATPIYTETSIQYLGYFRRYLLMFFRTYLRTLPVLHVPFYHRTHTRSLSSTLLPSPGYTIVNLSVRQIVITFIYTTFLPSSLRLPVTRSHRV